VDTAPYHAEVSSGPPRQRAVWLTASDGARLRAVDWPGPGDARGTVLIFQGRTEYIEKYSDAAAALATRGYASAAVDWRGQGLSDRTGHRADIGHVGDFGDFQRDVDALLSHCHDLDLPRPWHLLAHSMGGPIGLRALMRRGPDFSRAVFSAPMWGLPLPVHRRALAWTASALAAATGLGRRSVPGSGKVGDPVGAPFEGNLLTTDREMFAWMQRQIAAHPELSLGTPSLAWLWAALREMLILSREAAPDVPALTLLGSEEAIVDADTIHVRMASWPNGRVEMVEGARHEVLMEGAATRNRLYDTIAAHLG
jgi:lysophospholipase